MAKLEQSMHQNFMSKSQQVLSEVGIVFVAFSLLIFFGLTSKNFLTQQNILNIMQQISVVAIIAIGSTLIILITGIDLTAGAVVLLSGVIAGSLITNGVNEFWAILLALVAGMIIGLVNGFFIEIIKISAVIVTLGMMMVIRGIAQIILIFYGSWIDLYSPVFNFIATKRFGVVPFTVVVTLILYFLAYLILQKTSFGRYIYAIGNNEIAAKLCGVSTVKIKIITYVLGGLFSSIAGVILGARLGFISPQVGMGLEFDAITAAVLGGISLKGGVGKVEKTLLGAILVGLVLNYLTLAGISAYLQQAVKGFLILLAATLNRYTLGKQNEN